MKYFHINSVLYKCKEFRFDIIKSMFEKKSISSINLFYLIDLNYIQETTIYESDNIDSDIYFKTNDQ